MKKQNWNSPKITSLNVEYTYSEPRMPNSDYNYPVKCSICGRVFNNADEYEKHKTNEYFNGNLLGTECPQASHDDGVLTATMIAIS